MVTLEAEAQRTCQAHGPVVIKSAQQYNRPIPEVGETCGKLAADAECLALALQQSDKPADGSHVRQRQILTAHVIQLEKRNRTVGGARQICKRRLSGFR